MTNPRNPLDVNDDGHVAPVDVLQIVNYLNRDQNLVISGESPYYDVNGDGEVAPIDVLQIVNYLNRNPVGAEAVMTNSYQPDSRIAASLEFDEQFEFQRVRNTGADSEQNTSTKSVTSLAKIAIDSIFERDDETVEQRVDHWDDELDIFRMI